MLLLLQIGTEYKNEMEKVGTAVNGVQMRSTVHKIVRT